MSDVEQRIEQWLTALNGSELLSSTDVIELEAHLREEMVHLKAADLSDEEAFLVARRRLGDTAVIEQEFAKVSPHRRLSTRLSWMAAGVLGYLLIMHLSQLATKASTLLGYTLGLRELPLTLLACAMQGTAFAAIGVVVWWYIASRSPSGTATKRTSTLVRIGLFAACAIVALWWAERLGQFLLIGTLGMRDITQIMMAQSWASLGWSMLMPFLLVGLMAVLALRTRRPQVQ
jgi:hypothetical protein